jgi:hypothetical protein
MDALNRSLALRTEAARLRQQSRDASSRARGLVAAAYSTMITCGICAAPGCTRPATVEILESYGVGVVALRVCDTDAKRFPHGVAIASGPIGR